MTKSRERETVVDNFSSIRRIDDRATINAWKVRVGRKRCPLLCLSLERGGAGKTRDASGGHAGTPFSRRRRSDHLPPVPLASEEGRAEMRVTDLNIGRERRDGRRREWWAVEDDRGFN